MNCLEEKARNKILWGGNLFSHCILFFNQMGSMIEENVSSVNSRVGLFSACLVCQ